QRELLDRGALDAQLLLAIDEEVGVAPALEGAAIADLDEGARHLEPRALEVPGALHGVETEPRLALVLQHLGESIELVHGGHGPWVDQSARAAKSNRRNGVLRPAIAARAPRRVKPSAWDS